jgi:hemoglobin
MRLLSAALMAAALATTPAAAQMMSAPAPMKKTLYERLGGVDAIKAVVDDFVGNVAADKRINRYFAKADIIRLKRNLVDQICQGTGGPCVYRGRSMKEAHAGMGVRGRDFNALVGDLGKSLNKFKVPAREQKELVAILAPMKKDIVTR